MKKRYTAFITHELWEKIRNGIPYPKTFLDETNEQTVDTETDNIYKYFTQKMGGILAVQLPIYDVKRQGYIVSSIDLDEITAQTSTGFSNIITRYGLTADMIKGIMQLLIQKYSHAVYPKNMDIYEYAVGVVSTESGCFDVNNVQDVRLYFTLPQLSIMFSETFCSELARYGDIIKYEIAKFEKMLTMGGTNNTFAEYLLNQEALREALHIENKVQQVYANTPEVVPQETMLEMLEKYASSVYKTEQETEDWLDKVMGRIKNSLNEIIDKIATKILITWEW